MISQAVEKSISEKLILFEIAAMFVIGYGWLGIIRLDNTEVFRSCDFHSTSQTAIDNAYEFVNKNHKQLLLQT